MRLRIGEIKITREESNLRLDVQYAIGPETPDAPKGTAVIRTNEPETLAEGDLTFRELLEQLESRVTWRIKDRLE